MKTLWLSFSILYIASIADARFLRELIAAVAIEDRREYNNALPPQINDGVVVSGNGRKFDPPYLNSSGKSRYTHGYPPR